MMIVMENWRIDSLRWAFVASPCPARRRTVGLFVQSSLRVRKNISSLLEMQLHYIPLAVQLLANKNAGSY